MYISSTNSSKSFVKLSFQIVSLWTELKLAFCCVQTDPKYKRIADTLRCVWKQMFLPKDVYDTVYFWNLHK